MLLAKLARRRLHLRPGPLLAAAAAPAPTELLADALPPAALVLAEGAPGARPAPAEATAACERAQVS